MIDLDLIDLRTDLRMNNHLWQNPLLQVCTAIKDKWNSLADCSLFDPKLPTNRGHYLIPPEESLSDDLWATKSNREVNVRFWLVGEDTFPHPLRASRKADRFSSTGILRDWTKLYFVSILVKCATLQAHFQSWLLFLLLLLLFRLNMLAVQSNPHILECFAFHLHQVELWITQHISPYFSHFHTHHFGLCASPEEMLIPAGISGLIWVHSIGDLRFLLLGLSEHRAVHQHSLFFPKPLQ